jgi:hypothetical protein
MERFSQKMNVADREGWWVTSSISATRIMQGLGTKSVLPPMLMCKFMPQLEEPSVLSERQKAGFHTLRADLMRSTKNFKRTF